MATHQESDAVGDVSVGDRCGRELFGIAVCRQWPESEAGAGTSVVGGKPTVSARLRFDAISQYPTFAGSKRQAPRPKSNRLRYTAPSVLELQAGE